MGVKGERRQFSQEFKKNAVQLVMEKGVPVRKVARDLDIHPYLVHQWRRLFLVEGDGAFVGKGNLKPEEAEIKRLQKELEEVKEERDILKRALGVFSKRKVKYLFIEKHQGVYRLTGCARYWESVEVVITPGGSENRASGGTRTSCFWVAYKRSTRRTEEFTAARG
jgi:transposase